MGTLEHSTDAVKAENFFQTGGSLPMDLPSYIERPADKKLYAEVIKGNFCYVLTARQMGKSSLRVRTMQRLIAEGKKCAVVDITSIGITDTSSEKWYYSFLYNVSGQLGLKRVFKAWWAEHQALTMVDRFATFLEWVITDHVDTHLCIFIDEIDSLLSLDKQVFSINDFFAAIRSLFNKRVDNPALKRLNFVIIGVASPSDLMRDKERTPFNIGVPVQLEYFDFESAKVMLPGFAHINTDRELLLKEVLRWTGGQPVLTQKLAAEIAVNEREITHPEKTVNLHVERLFFTENAARQDSHLSHVEMRIVSNELHGLQMLEIYEQLLEKKAVRFNPGDHAQTYLRLTGLVKEQGAYLAIVNPIYSHLFDKAWVTNLKGKIDRPFALDVKRWLEAEKSDGTLLHADVLDEAMHWFLPRNDLSDLEMEFIARNLEGRKERDQKRKRTRKSRIIGGFLMLIFLSFSITLSVLYIKDNKIETLETQYVDLQKDYTVLNTEHSTVMSEIESLEALKDRTAEQERLLVQKQEEVKRIELNLQEMQNQQAAIAKKASNSRVIQSIKNLDRETKDYVESLKRQNDNLYVQLQKKDTELSNYARQQKTAERALAAVVEELVDIDPNTQKGKIKLQLISQGRQSEAKRIELSSRKDLQNEYANRQGGGWEHFELIMKYVQLAMRDSRMDASAVNRVIQSFDNLGFKLDRQQDISDAKAQFAKQWTFAQAKLEDFLDKDVESSELAKKSIRWALTYGNAISAL